MFNKAELLIVIEKVSLSSAEEFKLSALIMALIVPFECLGTVKTAENETGTESFAMTVALGKLHEPIFVVLSLKVIVLDSEVPEYVTLNVTVRELLCSAVVGEVIDDMVTTPALAKLARSKTTNTDIRGNINFFDVILCCNSVITLVYKFIYLPEQQ